MNPDQIADDAAYCAAYVDAAHLGASSATEYLRAMAHDYEQQARMFDNAHRGHLTDRHHEMAADALRRATVARARSDAYADALRVLDIAADSAHRRNERQA
jgi:hypothetical protein